MNFHFTIYCFGLHRHQALSYSTTPGDEVEDMFILLSEVKKQIPSVSAVSSGAIASDYQRLRVESVCSRLGLVSLAYLWKQDQSYLLQQMVNFLLSVIWYPIILKLLVLTHCFYCLVLLDKLWDCCHYSKGIMHTSFSFLTVFVLKNATFCSSLLKLIFWVFFNTV